MDSVWITGKIYNGAQITSGRAAVPYYVAKNTSNGEYFYSNTTADFPSGYTSQGTLGYIYDNSVSGSNELLQAIQIHQLLTNGQLGHLTLMMQVKC